MGNVQPEAAVVDQDGIWALQLRERACVVDTALGRLVYADAPEEPVTGEPYVLAYLNGAEEERLTPVLQ